MYNIFYVTMEKTEKVLIAIVIAAAAIAVVFMLVNASGPASGQKSPANSTFESEPPLVRTNDIVFNYSPNAVLPGAYTAAYQFRKDNVTKIQDRHTFTNVSPMDPIQIGFPNTGNGTYEVYMLIDDQNNNPVHKSLSVLVLGNDTSFSSQSLLDTKPSGNPFSSPIPLI
jgi:hypothetical protein